MKTFMHIIHKEHTFTYNHIIVPSIKSPFYEKVSSYIILQGEMEYWKRNSPNNKKHGQSWNFQILFICHTLFSENKKDILSYTMNVYFQRYKYFLIKYNYKVIWSSTNFHIFTHKEIVPVITDEESYCNVQLTSQKHIHSTNQDGDSSLLSEASSSSHMMSSFLTPT